MARLKERRRGKEKYNGDRTTVQRVDGGGVMLLMMHYLKVYSVPSLKRELVLKY